MSSSTPSQPPADTQQDSSEFSTSKRMKTDDIISSASVGAADTAAGTTSINADTTKEDNINVKSEAVQPLSISIDEDMKMKGSGVNDEIQIKLGPSKGDVCYFFFFSC